MHLMITQRPVGLLSAILFNICLVFNLLIANATFQNVLDLEQAFVTVTEPVGDGTGRCFRSLPGSRLPAVQPLWSAARRHRRRRCRGCVFLGLAEIDPGSQPLDGDRGIGAGTPSCGTTACHAGEVNAPAAPSTKVKTSKLMGVAKLSPTSIA